MKKFIIKTLVFLVPIILLILIVEKFYHTDKGDLAKIGFILQDGTYRSIFQDDFKDTAIYFDELITLKQNRKKSYTALTIGDSFSEQEHFGFKNYLANYDSISVLHYNPFIVENPIQELINIVNGDLLDSISIEYVILESIERDFVKRNEALIWNSTFNFNDLDKIIDKLSDKRSQSSTSVPSAGYKLFTDKIIKVLLTNIMYLFQDKPSYSKTYKVKTKKPLFSSNENSLLFYYDDIKKLPYNNSFEKVDGLNTTLNKLSQLLNEKGVQLIVLPAPDKYDVYYDFISNNERFIKPLFFEHLAKLEMKYHFINSQQLLKEAVERKNDVYFYDDTHWSPLAAKLVAKELKNIIH